MEDKGNHCEAKLCRNFCTQTRVARKEDEIARCTGDKKKLKKGGHALPETCQNIVDGLKSRKQSK